jgi:hypothetical protein
MATLSRSLLGPPINHASFFGLLVEPQDFGKLELLFAGILFELEHQRNLGDASFKT